MDPSKKGNRLKNPKERKFLLQKFSKSQSIGGVTGIKHVYDERNARDKIQNLLDEMKHSLGNSEELQKATREYEDLMKKEQVLANRYPTEFFEKVRGNYKSNKRKAWALRLDQSPLSKLITKSESSTWQNGAKIQLESLQASDQLLSELQGFAVELPTPDLLDVELYPKDCDDEAREKILFFLDKISEEKNGVRPIDAFWAKKEYVSLVCKEHELKKEYKNKFEECAEKYIEPEDIDVGFYILNTPMKGILFSIIQNFLQGDISDLAKGCLHPYYTLKMSEQLLRDKNEDSDRTYQLTIDIQECGVISSHSESVDQALLTEKSGIKNYSSCHPHYQQLTEQPQNSRHEQHMQQNDLTGKSVKKPNVSLSLQHTSTKKLQGSHTGPGGGSKSKTSEMKSKSDSMKDQSEGAFGIIYEPGDRNVRDWSTAYADLYKSWSLQKSQVDELTNRLSSFASKQLVDGNPAFTDLSDKNRPTKIGEKFGQIYDDEWSEAFEELNEIFHNDRDVIFKLMRIVRYGYEYCTKKAKEQLDHLKQSMQMPILQPFNITTSVHVSKEMSKTLDSAVNKHSKDFRKITAPISSPEVCRRFFKEEEKFLKETFENAGKGVKLKSYVEACIEQLWLMCVQDPPMIVEYANEGTRIDKELYKVYEKKGNTVVLTVWPVVFLHKGGPVVSKGYVLPE